MPQNYELPAEKVITIGNKNFQCSQVSFKLKFIGSKQEGAYKQTFCSKRTCAVHIQKDLYIADSKKMTIVGPPTKQGVFIGCCDVCNIV